MLGYIIKLGSLSILATVSQLILPKGKMKSACKVVFSLLLISSIISSIDVLDLEFKYHDNESKQYIANLSSVSQIKDLKIDLLEADCINQLSKNGINNAQVSIVSSDNLSSIEHVEINLKNAVIDENFSHININVKAKEIIMSHLNFEGEIIIYE